MTVNGQWEETPYPIPEYHDLARTGRGSAAGCTGSRQENHDSPIHTGVNSESRGIRVEHVGYAAIPYSSNI